MSPTAKKQNKPLHQHCPQIKNNTKQTKTPTKTKPYHTKFKVIKRLMQDYTDANLHIQRDQFWSLETNNCLKFINATFFNKHQKTIHIALVKSYRTVYFFIPFACYSVFTQENNLIITCSV